MLKFTHIRLAVLVFIILTLTVSLLEWRAKTTLASAASGPGVSDWSRLGIALPDSYEEFKTLYPSSPQSFLWFGYGVAIDGDTLAVGAYGDGGAGAVYIYERNLGGLDNWGEAAKLSASDAQFEDYFGSAVSLSGDTLVVGAVWEDGGPGDPLPNAGAIYVFERNLGGPENWGEAARISAADARADAFFGHAVTISGNTIVVGAPYDDDGQDVNQGAVYIYERDLGGAGNWGERIKLQNSIAPAGVIFGWSVSIQLDKLVIGEIGSPGLAFIYERDLGGEDNWGLMKILSPTFPSEGPVQFGISTAIDDDTIVVGAFGETEFTGSAYVFDRDAGGPDNWGLAAHLTASDAQEHDYFGYFVGLSGDRVLVSAALEDGGPGDPIGDAGAAYVFERDLGGPGQWGEAAKLTSSNAQLQGHFSWSLTLAGETLVVGAAGEDGDPGDPLEGSGAAYIYLAETEPTATPTGTPTPSQTATATPTATPTLTPTQGRVTKTPTPGPTNTPGPSPTSGGGRSTPTAAVTNTPVPGDAVHVSDLDGSAAPNGPNRWDATVTITIVDQNGAPVAGATVSGIWSNGAAGSGNCQTDAAGQCSITRFLIRNLAGSVTFTVDDVSMPGYGYDPGANGDPDADSDGTMIVVSKP